MPKVLTATICCLLLMASSGCGLAPEKSFSISVDRARNEGLQPVSFHFSYPPSFARVKASSTAVRGKPYVTLVAAKQGKLREWAQVSYLDTLGQRKESAAFLPILMEGWKDKGAKAFAGYRLVQEGLTKIGSLRAYQVFFTAKSLPGGTAGSGFPMSTVNGSRDLQGRLILIPRPGLTGGVAITIVTGPASGFERTTEVGLKGLSQGVLNSFGFG